MEAANLKLGEEVDVRVEDGLIVISPLRTKTYRLDDLLKGITSRNRHEPADFGPPTGHEVW
jgi:antitoxin component of MazEF toxin-antitoxin module